MYMHWSGNANSHAVNPGHWPSEFPVHVNKLELKYVNTHCMYMYMNVVMGC